MAKVERLVSGKYRIRWTDPWGKRTSRTFATAADARAHYRKIQGDIARGVYVDPRRQRTTVAKWADDWLAGARKLSTGGRDTYRQDLDRYILPVLGRLPLVQVTPTTIDCYLTAELQRATPPAVRPGASAGGVGKVPTPAIGHGSALAPSTVHRHYRTLHRMFRVAVDRGLLPRNPCDPVEPPRIPSVERTVLDVAQVDQLAAAISPRYRAWVYVMAYGGLRWSESVGLRRKNVDAPHPPERGCDSPGDQPGGWGATPAEHVGAIHAGTACADHTARLAVVEQLIRRRSGEWERVEPKAGSRRTITLPGFVADELAAHLERYSAPGPDGLVFPTRNGTPPQGGSFRTNTFGRALAKAGLPRIRVHDLRHTAVSLAIAAGADPKASQARAGHSSIRIHLDTYGHLYPAADAAVAAALEELHAKTQRTRLRVVGD